MDLQLNFPPGVECLRVYGGERPVFLGEFHRPQFQDVTECSDCGAALVDCRCGGGE